MLKKPRLFASWDDGQRILNEADNKRDVLMIRLCLYMALREGEILGNNYSVRKDGGRLVALTLGDVDLINKTIYIHGKGGTQELVFIDKRTFILLSDWIKKHRIGGKNNRLFHITTRQFQNIVKELAIRAGVEGAKRFSPHVLRSIAITYYASKKGLSRARYFARHKSMNTTAIYDRPDRDTRRDEAADVFEDEDN